MIKTVPGFCREGEDKILLYSFPSSLAQIGRFVFSLPSLSSMQSPCSDGHWRPADSKQLGCWLGSPGNRGHVKNKMFSSVDSLLLAKCVQAHLQLQDLVNLGVWWEGWEVQPGQNPPVF